MRSKDVYEDVKIKKVREETMPDGTGMLKIDFTYTLLTRAGFTVLRRGVASASVANEVRRRPKVMDMRATRGRITEPERIIVACGVAGGRGHCLGDD